MVYSLHTKDINLEAKTLFTNRWHEKKFLYNTATKDTRVQCWQASVGVSARKSNGGKPQTSSVHANKNIYISQEPSI